MTVESLAILAVSLFILAKASEKAIDHATNLARFFKVSETTIGFLLLSVATSLPELVVSTMASLEGKTGLSIGNVLGSNIANICLILGVMAWLGHVVINRKESSILVKILFVTSIIPIILVWLHADYLAGLALLTIFLGFAWLVLKNKITPPDGIKVSAKEAVISALFFSLSILLILISAKYAVDSAINLANLIGISEAFIGATLIALGTSLPELAVSLTALKKHKTGMALGNILGSNVVNLTLVLGLAAVINPLNARLSTALTLVLFAVGSNLLVWHMTRDKAKISKENGLALIVFYLAFLLISLLAETKF